MGRITHVVQQYQNESQQGGLPTPRSPLPQVIRHATQQKFVKGEDVIFVQDSATDSAHDMGSKQFKLYCLCDGHQGAEAAHFVKECLWETLVAYMPETTPPANFNSAEGMRYAEQVRQALTLAFVEVDRMWSRQLKISGCTVTTAVVTGQLLTVANVGDSRAVLVCPDCAIPMTIDHRVQDNKSEKQRLKVAGAHVAPVAMTLQGPASSHDPGVGPLRVWPGGLCVSRSVGDVDVGPIILPTPHIKQVILPEQGSRLIIASDGLWDNLSTLRVARFSRLYPLDSVCNMLIKQCMAIRLGYLSDDTSVVAVDFLPNPEVTFPAIVKQLKQIKLQGQQQTNFRFFCFVCGVSQQPIDDDEIWTNSSVHSGLAMERSLYAEEDSSVHYCPVKGLTPDFVRVPFKNSSSPISELQKNSTGPPVKAKIRLTKGSLRRVDTAAYQDEEAKQESGDSQQEQRQQVAQESQSTISLSNVNSCTTKESSNQITLTPRSQDEQSEEAQPPLGASLSAHGVAVYEERMVVKSQYILRQAKTTNNLAPYLGHPNRASSGKFKLNTQLSHPAKTPRDMRVLPDTEYDNSPRNRTPRTSLQEEGAVHGNRLYFKLQQKQDLTAHNGEQFVGEGAVEEEKLGEGEGEGGEQ
eukprot:TRINITY_DN7745_c0_g1_i1.p1 TRINITY_DN7745_c0_g1~~TRINITY_DN7745_c0_g1_i1.p1  ORF type:complete len:636 (-),score=84.35 TRINITY_DN7745_c0_g1_i1:3714-5621(-)